MKKGNFLKLLLLPALLFLIVSCSSRQTVMPYALMLVPVVADGMVPVFVPGENTEDYDKIVENEFLDVLKNPVSTFGLDVDTASYANVRRYLNESKLPPKDAVRIEEMINYFKYNYPEPKKDAPVAITTEYSQCPWNTANKLLLIGVKAVNIAKENIPKSNLVFLIDVSGSMAEQDKLPLLIRAFKLLVNQLRPDDRVSIVVYAGASGVVLPSTSGDEKDRIIGALESLSAGGSTAGGEGLALAYKIAKENFITGGNNRVILATDGDFNVGPSSDTEMTDLIIKNRDGGVYISVLGFGQGNIKDSKMEKIADNGNGNFSYIDSVMEANKVLVSEFGGTMLTVAKDVKIQVEFNPAKVKSYRLIGYENRLLKREDFENDAKDAGDMGSGHSVTALYEIVPGGNENIGSGDTRYVETKAKAAAGSSDELLYVKLRYKKPELQNNTFEKSTEMSHMVMDKPLDFMQSGENIRFAAAVAQYGMLLRGSKYCGNATFTSTLEIARQAKGTDTEGYRAEFIKLIETADIVSKTGGSREEE